ncbi:MAG: DNA alkylation repair protein [Dysgonamonadaceae bacterium]|nr:DNA alkylation repair protein [Dysgonamonadaceae bacterium]MDD4729907.1 DNA alkylation repair protein [Dysgonamonadaceae bacterium]
MMEELIRNIRTDLRLAMNGVVSSSMREKGMDYKMNFGVDVPRLKNIALKYKENAALAQTIWKLDVREMKMLATMIYPINEFSESKADEWAAELQHQEIREHLCRNLLQKLSYSDVLVQKWTSNNNPSIRLTGFWLYVRLMLINADLLQNINISPIIEQALKDVKSEDSLLSRAALNVLKHLVRRDEKSTTGIMEKVAEFANSDNPKYKEIFDDLTFELEHKS